MTRREQEAAMGGSFSEEDERRRALMEAIFREHFTAVHRSISNKVRQPDVADDLTSMVFLKAFRWLREDRGVGQIRSWLYATARTTIADYWQEQQKSLFLPLERIEDSSGGTTKILTKVCSCTLWLCGTQAPCKWGLR
jgi:DNA-directed RNA polymerase specialized sigma24 family protein